MNTTIQNRQIVEEMINSISKEDKLRQLFRANKIADIEKIFEINSYKRDGYRRGFIIEVQEKNADARSKIMIDLKQGQPLIDQVYDSLYGIGKDCSKRIIIYSGHNDFDQGIPVADYWPVICLINNLQQYPLGIHLLEMNRDTFAVGPHFMHEYFEPDQEYSVSDVPTKEQFMAETFWTIYFDSFTEGFYEPHMTFSNGFRNLDDWGHIIYIDCSFFGEIQLYWDQKGVRYVVKQKDDFDEYLKMVLNFEMEGLQKLYGKDAVEFKNLVGKLPRLHIKYSDKPFDWLYTATPRQITEFAKAMHEDAWALRWRIEERIDGIMKRESAY
jgi:hypothetical protein